MKRFQTWQIVVAIIGSILVPLFIFIIQVGNSEVGTEIEVDNGINIRQEISWPGGGGGDGSVTIEKGITVRRHSNTTSSQGGTNAGTNTR